MTYHDSATPDDLYTVAQDLLVLGKFADAIPAYTSALESDPTHIQARCGRGLAFQRLGEHHKAIADFDKVITCFPDWPGAFVAYHSRAASRQALGQNLEAVEDCNEAINRNPEFIDAIYLRGTARKALEQFEAAVSDMDAVLDADPTYHEAYRVRGSLYLLQHRWRQAIDDFTAAIERSASGLEGARQCFYLRGMAAQEFGDHSAAITDFSRAIELAPGDCGAYFRRSRSYAEIGESTLADADFQTGSRIMHGQ